MQSRLGPDVDGRLDPGRPVESAQGKGIHGHRIAKIGQVAGTRENVEGSRKRQAKLFLLVQSTNLNTPSGGAHLSTLAFGATIQSRTANRSPT